MMRARLTSSADNPPQSWVISVTSTMLNRFVHSGWWFNFSAASAARDINPHASEKLRNFQIFRSASRSGKKPPPPGERQKSSRFPRGPPGGGPPPRPFSQGGGGSCSRWGGGGFPDR